MSGGVGVGERGIVEVLPKPRDLDVLATVIREHHEQTVAAARTTLHHAILVGSALIEARRQVPSLAWRDWLRDQVDLSEQTAGSYMRLSVYQAQIPPNVSDPQTALAALHGLPGRDTLRREERAAEASVLFAEGLREEAIAQLMGVTTPTVKAWLDPQRIDKANAAQRRKYEQQAREHTERQKRQREEALRRRDAKVKAAGGELAEAYALTRKVAQLLDRAQAQSRRGTSKSLAIEQAVYATYRVEDEIASALRLVEFGASERERRKAAA